MEAKILVVDDDLEVREVIVESLKRSDFDVVACASGQEALTLPLEEFDLLLLDVMMPNMDGFELCLRVRDRVDAPILFLTAKTADRDVIQGLEMGGDDYLRKPFTPLELVSRVKAHLRREKRIRHSVLVRGKIRFNLQARQISIEGETLPFTKMEYELCELLARHPGQVFSREQMLEHAGGIFTESDPSAIAEHIKNIRKKFVPYKIQPIQTIWGIGYRWEEGREK